MMRRLCGVAGIALCVLMWVAPLTDAGLGHFTAHMLRHMMVVAVGTFLIVLGFPALMSRITVSPVVATAIEFLVVWGWHLPWLHDAARFSPFVFTAEQASFLVAGLLIWASVLQPGRELAGAGGLLLTSMHMTLLGALITLSPQVLYTLNCAPGDALRDQQLGGMVMLAIGTPVYLIAGLALVGAGLRESHESGEAA
jgi:putative membrane protein